MKAYEIGAGTALAVSAFLGAHPFLLKALSAITLAIISTVVSQLVQRFFPRKQP